MSDSHHGSGSDEPSEDEQPPLTFQELCEATQAENRRKLRELGFPTPPKPVRRPKGPRKQHVPDPQFERSTRSRTDAQRRVVGMEDIMKGVLSTPAQEQPSGEGAMRQATP